MMKDVECKPLTYYVWCGGVPLFCLETDELMYFLKVCRCDIKVLNFSRLRILISSSDLLGDTLSDMVTKIPLSERNCCVCYL